MGIPENHHASSIIFASMHGWACETCKTDQKRRIDVLEATVRDQSAAISNLQQLVNSWPVPTPSLPPTGQSIPSLTSMISDQPQSAATSSSSLSSAVTYSQVLQTIKKTVTDVNRRNKNVIVSGITESENSDSDSLSFVKMCKRQLNLNIRLDHNVTRRLGKDVPTSPSRPRRLQVRLASSEVVSDLLCRARDLGESDDEYVRNNIYLNRV